MRLLKCIYEKAYRRQAPYYFDYSLMTIVKKPIRKWITNSVAANCPFNTLRILLYRLCGFKIGKHTFIGMRCYLDDMCYDLMSIGDNVTISYGVYFACHGKRQGHCQICVKDGAYIGMRTSIVAKKKIEIGKNSVIGACTLVNRSIPDGKTAVGIPCHIVNSKDDTENE